MARTQNKAAEREFFNRSARQPINEHAFHEETCVRCFHLLGIGPDLRNATILEAGCGAGDWGRRLALRNARVTGVDLADEMIACNRKLNADVPGYDSLTGDLENTSLFPENSFDAITCFNVLHHFPDIDAVIRNFNLWLRDGGVLYAVEPNGGNLTNRISKIVRRLIAPVMGRMITKKGLATVNEMKDHSMGDYLTAFGRHDFVCDMKASLTGMSAFPRGRLLSLTTCIDRVKWVLYQTADRMPGDPINRGNPLVFRMSINKMSPCTEQSHNPCNLNFPEHDS